MIVLQWYASVDVEYWPKEVARVSIVAYIVEHLLEKVSGVSVVVMDVAGIGSVCVGGALLDDVW